MKEQAEKKLFEDNVVVTDVLRKSIKQSFIAKYDEGITPTYTDLPLDEDLFPAAPDWNFFPELSKTKMQELIISIAESGQLEPIIVWEQLDKRKMILSGHNRVKALKYLYEATNDARFSTVHAKVYRYEDLTEDKAKDIIVLTNYARRNLNTALIKKCVVYYYKSLAAQNFTGNRLLHTAVTFNLSKRMVQYYLNISLLIEPFQKLLHENRLSISVVPILAKFSAEDQDWLINNFSDQLTNEKIASINSDMSKTELRKIFMKKEKKFVNITLSVPEENKEEVYSRIESLIESLSKEMGVDIRIKRK